MKTYPYYLQEKDIPGSLDFSDVEVMQKFIGCMTANLDCMVTVLFK